MELKPCPFCGEEAEVSYAAYIGGGGFGLIVSCTRCWAKTGHYSTKEEAIKAWNTRAERTCRMERIEDEKRILHGWMECSECGPVYPPAAEGIQDAVKFCPFCGRKVVEHG